MTDARRDRRPPGHAAPVHLSLENLRLGYGDSEVLFLPGLEFPAGLVTALVGPVASGKSSLLRLIAGLEDFLPSCWHEGGIHYRNTDSPAASVALIAQKARLYVGTVGSNVGTSPDDPRLREWTRRLDLDAWLADHWHADVGQLSLAGHRAILLIRSLIDGPGLLLLDEPLSDVSVSEEPWLLTRIRRLSGLLTVIVVTHNKDQARIVSDRIALVSGGRLIEAGETAAFFERPATALGQAWLESGSAWPAPDWNDECSPAPADPVAAGPRPPTALRVLGFHWVRRKRLGGLHQPGLLNDLPGDLRAIVDLGVRRLITLTEAPLAIRDGDLDADLLIEHFPIPDMRAPDAGDCAAILQQLGRTSAKDEAIAFHCRGGLGRTGLMLACFLIADEQLDAATAIDQVRRINGSYIQSAEQLAFVQAFPEALDNWRRTRIAGPRHRE